MVNDNGFDLKDLVPAEASPALEAPARAMVPALNDKPKYEIDVMTETNEKSIIAMLPPQTRKTIQETYNSPEWEEHRNYHLAGQEYELSRKLKPAKIDHSLRYSLWTQYYRALETGAKTINLVQIFAGITTSDTFDKLLRSARLFWLLLPPTDYTAMNRRAHDRGLDRMYEVLDTNPVSEDGKVDYKLIALQLKIWAVLDTRINGPVTHKHEITTKNLHLGISAEEVKKLYTETDREIKSLAKQDIVIHEDDLKEVQKHVYASDT